MAEVSYNKCQGSGIAVTYTGTNLPNASDASLTM